jgi:hypothetical protein
MNRLIFINFLICVSVVELFSQCPAPNPGNKTGCSNATVTLQAITTNPSVTAHNWYYDIAKTQPVSGITYDPNSQSARISQYTQSFTSNKTFYVYSVCSGVESSSYATVTFTLDNGSNIGIQLSQQIEPTNLCFEDNVYMTAIGGSYYEWRFGSPTGSYTSGTTYTPTQSGTYYLTGTNSCGSSQTTSIPIVIKNRVGTPTISRASTGSVCKGTATTVLNATATDANFYTWSISNAGSSTITASGDKHEVGTVNWDPSFSGTADVTVVVSGCNGSSATSSPFPINVEVPSVVALTIKSTTAVGSTITVCPSQSVGFTVESKQNVGSSPTYTWYIGTDVVSSDQPALGPDYFVKNNWTAANNSVVTCRVQSSLTGCLSNNPATSNGIQVAVKTQDQLEAFSASITTLPERYPMTYCPGEISFRANASHSVSSYQWYKNGVSVGTNSQTYAPSSFVQGDSVRVKVIASQNPCLRNTTAMGKTIGMPITIRSPLVVGNISGISSRCQGAGSSQFSSSITGADSSTWSIVLKSTITPNALNNQINKSTGLVTWDPGFIGVVTIKIKGFGCGGPIEKSKDVNVDETYGEPSLTLEGPEFVCPGTQASFYVRESSNVGTAPNYQFFINGDDVDNADPNIPDDRLVIPSWDYVNGLPVSCIVTNTNSCKVGDGVGESDTISVYTNFSNVTLTPVVAGPRCQGADTTRFKPSMNLTSYQWSISDASGSSISSSGLVNWSSATVGTSTISISAPECPAIKTSTTYITAPAAPTLTDKSGTACDWEFVLLTAPGDPDQTNWYDENNELKHTGTQFPLGHLYETGSYTFYMEQVSWQGCKSAGKASYVLTITDDCDDKLNYTTRHAFDQNGDTISHVRQYFDHVGNLLQSQTKGFDVNKIFVSQDLKDRYGRNVGSLLPAPSALSEYRYNLRYFWSSSRRPYDHRDFDNPSIGNITNPAEVNDTIPGTVGWYYSANNNAEENVPETDFPYARNEYYNDGYDEIRRKASPGNEHRLGRGHEMLSGTFPVYEELNDYLLKRRAIGLPDSQTNNSFLNEGIQSVIRDENGKFAISITDRSGKTVMSARAGTPSDSALTISNNIVSSGDSTLESFRPMTYFYLLTPQVVSVTGSTDFVAEDLITEEKKLPGQTFAGPDGKWPVGFYRILLTNTSSQITLSYSTYLLDVSYQFYDDAGRLRASLSPNGFIQQKSNGGVIFNNTQDLTPIVDATSYKYNHQGLLMETQEPDAGKTQFLYRADGKIRFSQNALQKENEVEGEGGRFSYTTYDLLGRPVESGEFKGTEFQFTAMTDQLEFSQQLDYDSGLIKDWTRTHYDSAASSIPNLPSAFKQEFLRGSVSWTENANVETWYSYNEFGQLAWMAQKPRALNRTFLITYDYDFFGNVMSVKNCSYVSGTELQPFYHHYTYDKDNRLQQVWTSVDSVTLKKRASYEYYLHGPLKRIILGDTIQNIDFVYNINGWLRRINDPHDFTNQASPNHDVFSMVLDYYESTLPGVFTSGAFKNNYNQFTGIPLSPIFFGDGDVNAISPYPDRKQNLEKIRRSIDSPVDKETKGKKTD